MSQDTREMYADLFKGASATTVEVPLLEETLRDARALIEEQKWDEQEGLQIIFANGLYYLRGERSLGRLCCDHDALAREVERLTEEQKELEALHAENRRLRQRLAELETPEAEPTTQRRRQPLLARILNVFRR